MFSTVARLKYDDGKNKGEEVIAVSSVTLGRPFCSALQTCVISLRELSDTSAISHFLKARRFFFSSFFSWGGCERFDALTIRHSLKCTISAVNRVEYIPHILRDRCGVLPLGFCFVFFGASLVSSISKLETSGCRNVFEMHFSSLQKGSAR